MPAPNYGADYDRIPIGPNGPMIFSTGNPSRPISRDAYISDRQQQDQLHADEARQHKTFQNRLKWAKILGIGIPTAGVGLSAAGVGAGASAAGAGGWSMPGVTAPTFGATAATGTTAPLGVTTAAKAGLGARLGKIFSSAGFETGTNAALALFGQRSQNKANTQARTDALAAQTKTIELEQQRLAQELSNANLDREDARALNAAIQELEKRKFALQQEQAQFERGEYEKEQSRLAPYRQTSDAARQRLSQILGLG